MVWSAPKAWGTSSCTRLTISNPLEQTNPRLRQPWLSPNPPKDTDGRREDSGRGVRELQGRWPGLHWGRWEVGGRSSVAAQGPLWPSAGVAMRGMAREYAAGNARGPGWREFAGTLGQLQAGRQAGSGMARSRAKARVNWDSQGQRRGRCRVRAARRAGDPSHQSEDPPPEGLGGYGPFAQTNRAVQRARLWAITWTASQAPLAAKRPDGMWFSPTPYLRSRMAFSISAWRGDDRPPVPASPHRGR